LKCLKLYGISSGAGGKGGEPSSPGGALIQFLQGSRGEEFGRRNEQWEGLKGNRRDDKTASTGK